MRLLLDTHVALWSLLQPERLPVNVEALVRDAANDVYVSAASIWEISIKFALRKPTAPPFDGRTAVLEFRALDFEILSVNADHAAGIDLLPTIHGDPFDRIIAAQALVEPLTLVTHDRRLAAYSETFISW
jgi:PIN domain nuclease of toxin-antitoxin system